MTDKKVYEGTRRAIVRAQSRARTRLSQKYRDEYLQFFYEEKARLIAEETNRNTPSPEPSGPEQTHQVTDAGSEQ